MKRRKKMAKADVRGDLLGAFGRDPFCVEAAAKALRVDVPTARRWLRELYDQRRIIRMMMGPYAYYGFDPLGPMLPLDRKGLAERREYMALRGLTDR